uniref:Uncharacterized protein n=1 Tax=Rhizophora mucronata TaxID=61149 RepID=A0A2P2IYE5_RHIMU
MISCENHKHSCWDRFHETEELKPLLFR